MVTFVHIYGILGLCGMQFSSYEVKALVTKVHMKIAHSSWKELQISTLVGLHFQILGS
jgi:hypothetical protein